MSTEAFLSDVNVEVADWAAANFPNLPVIYENGPVPDEDKIGPIWLDLEVRWYSAKPMSIGEVIQGRHSGAISMNVYFRQGEGTKQVSAVIDSLKDTFKLRRLGKAVVKFPQRTVPSTVKGWYKSGLLFPFTLDE